MSNDEFPINSAEGMINVIREHEALFPGGRDKFGKLIWAIRVFF